MRCCIACAAALFVLVASTPEAHAEESGGGRAALTFSNLMARFAALPGLEARFREERRSALLVEPLVTEGSLYYAPPARMARHTVAPSASTMVLTPGQLVLAEERGRRRIDLHANLQIRHVVEGFLLLLAGDEAALSRRYDVSFTPRPQQGPEAWEMVLVPRSRQLRRAVREVRLRGDGVVVREMRIHEASGDETVTVFEQVDVTRRYTEAEVRQLFTVPGT